MRTKVMFYFESVAVTHETNRTICTILASTYSPIWSKVRYISRPFSALTTCCSRMRLSCPARACKYMISRNVRCASVALRKASKHFFNAKTWRLRFSIAFHTTPYACVNCEVVNQCVSQATPETFFFLCGTSMQRKNIEHGHDYEVVMN